jgi:hypothetical protein
MPIGMIESINPLNYKLVYGRADGMPNSLKSMVVCNSYSHGGVINTTSHRNIALKKNNKDIQQWVFASGHPPNY